MVRLVLLTLVTLSSVAFPAPIAAAFTLSRPDAHALIGVMGEHVSRGPMDSLR